MPQERMTTLCVPFLLSNESQVSTYNYQIFLTMVRTLDMDTKLRCHARLQQEKLGICIALPSGLPRNYLGRHLLSYLGYGIFKDSLKDYIKPTMGLTRDFLIRAYMCRVI